MDFSLGHFPVDLVLLALVAAFLVLRLRSVLGKRVGIQPVQVQLQVRPDAAPRVVEGKPEQAEAAAAFDIPAPGTRVGTLLADIRQKDPSFTPQQFLNGAQVAFAQVVGAYAQGNVDVLKTYLTPAVLAAFEAGITARTNAEETQRTDVKAIRSLAIEDVRFTSMEAGTAAAIDVRIVSDQISLVLNKEGQPVTGTDAVTEFSDLWTFERLLNVNGSTWRLAAARSA